MNPDGRTEEQNDIAAAENIKRRGEHKGQTAAGNIKGRGEQ